MEEVRKAEKNQDARMGFEVSSSYCDPEGA